MALPNKTKIPVGTVLAGKYRITREIGRGGMATVHEAENVDIGKRVAIKVLAQELTGSSIVVERFLREARAAAAIRSPYICDVYDSGKLPTGQPFLVLELLEGESLYERMTRQRQLDPATTIAVISQVCRGLTKAHAASIVHRDLKPENIFLTKDEEGQLLAKILDFGLAKFYTPTTKDQARLTREGAVFGTPAYMSPEQVRGQGAVDHRADLWALGCITYECFTGKTVWSTDQGVAMTFAQIASAPLPRPARYRPDLPQSFTDWFDRTLDRNIDRRFQTAKEFAEALANSFGMERRETSEIRPSPIEQREEALAALASAAASVQPAPGAPPASGRHAQPPPPSAPAPPSPRQPQPPHVYTSDAAAHPQAGQPHGYAPAPDDPAAHFRPMSPSDADGDPTRVLSKHPPVRQLDPGSRAPGARPSSPDGKLERFRRTADGRIAKVVPQVAPAAPPVPAGMRPAPTPLPGSQRAPAMPAMPAQPPIATHRPRPSGTPPAPGDHDSELGGNPFAKAQKRRRIIIIVTLLVLAVMVVLFAVTSSGPESGSGDSGSGSGSAGTAAVASGAPAGSAAPEATSRAAPVRTGTATSGSPSQASLPGWMGDVRAAQTDLTAGNMKGALDSLGRAATKSGQHAAVQGLQRHVSGAVWIKGTCTLTGVARPRTYDLATLDARRTAATKPSVVAIPNGALVAWTDAHTGPSHAYLARLDGGFAVSEPAFDLTPDGVDVKTVELYPWGDKHIVVYTDAKAAAPGTYARWLGADGKPGGASVQVGPAKSALAAPAIFGAQGRALYVAWSDDGDRDSEDLFLQKLSDVTLAPEGTPARITDLVPSGAPRARAILPRGTVARDQLRVVFELERKPASFIEQQTIPFGEVGRDLTTTGTNREGKSAGTLALVNLDKSRAHAPQIGCSSEMCFVVWHGESPPGAQGAAFDLASGRALWRRKLSPKAQYPAVAASQGGGAAAAWIEDGHLVAAPLGRAGYGRSAWVARAGASQPVVSLTATPDKGGFLVAWLDIEATLPEPYVARLRCP